MAVRRRVRRRRREKRRFSRGMKKSLFIFFACVFVLFSALFVRIYLLNKDHGDAYKKQVFSQQAYTNTVLSYRRGTIKDRNDTILAQSIRKYNLIIEPRTLNVDPAIKSETLANIAKYFVLDVSQIEEVIDSHPDSMYQHIDGLKELTDEQIDGFRQEMEENENVQGVWFEETYTRDYPLKNIACNIVGFTASENEGTYGIEGSYNAKLNGTTGREYGYFDANMNFQRTIKKATNGNSVVLTIDANVQRIVEKMIRNYNKNVGAENIAVMLMNPNNGEILAMASQNTYDLNDPRNMSAMYTEDQINNMSEEETSKNLMKMWSNFCIASAYEPGSTYKPFTVAAALDEGLISDNSTFGCSGVMNILGSDIHCAVRSGHGLLTLQQSMMQSCNSALMQIGQKLGRNRFTKYNKIYGFGQRTGIDLPGETAGLIHSKEQLNPVELATSSFGQTQTVTMVQMLAGFSSLINGGNYYQPHLVKEIQNENGATVDSIEPVVVKKTISESTSALIRKYMKATVEEGTAAPAQVKGYSIGGKTGTAQKRPTAARKYLVSFIGCVPAENPELAIYVIIDEPHVEDQAHSTYATEFASKIMKKILPFLGIYGEEMEEADTTAAPDAGEEPAVEGQQDASSKEEQPEEEKTTEEETQQGESGEEEPTQE